MQTTIQNISVKNTAVIGIAICEQLLICELHLRKE